MADNFFIENMIYYHDTDAGGVVYYGKYLEHLEEGRNEYCRHKGVDLGAYRKMGVQFAVVHAEVEYKYPARYGDRIRIYCRVEKVGDSSVHFAEEIKKEDILLVRSKAVWVCIGADFKSRPLPQEIRQALEVHG